MHIKIENKTLRQFNLIFSFYFIVLIFILSRLNHHTIISREGWLIFAIMMSASFIFPPLILPIKIVWDSLLKSLHVINTHLLLGMIFYGLFTPIAILRRLRNKDVLSRSFDKEAKSYRTSVNTEKNDLRRIY